MCGIYGSTISYPADIVREKLRRIGFRGPDYSAFKQTDKVILGHNRLAIIDLDHRSDQPFSYHHLEIVFNGEIYNYLQLRTDLQNRGYQFKTESDTEVICASYLEFGQSCVQHFNGMFAFVVYDRRNNELFGARDRLGKKPFYYYHQRDQFEFSSQPSQITIGNNFSQDDQAFREYFMWGYIPEPRSAWREIKKLPAGHSFRFDMQTGNLLIEKYWDLDYEWSNMFSGAFEEASECLRYVLEDAVKIRMHADVPLGVFLSGGIDSSLVAALASKVCPSVKTFAIKFNENGFDESDYAEKVASALGTNHHTIECNYREGIELIKTFSTYYDEPFADSSAIPGLLLSKHTRQHVTVALSGDGGDEAFSGYLRYKRIQKLQTLYRFPLAFRKLMGHTLKLSPNYVHKLIGMGISFEEIQTLYIWMFGGLESSWLLEPQKGLENPNLHILKNPAKPLIENLSDFDIKTYLNDDINTKVDRASMAFSLEVRSPLMDYRILELSRSFPHSFKFHKGIQKRILKDILFQYLPQKLFDRPKSGFTMPFREWFKHDLRDYVLDHLSKNKLADIPGICPEKSGQLIQDHLDGKWNRTSQIWKLLVFSQWQSQQSATVPSASF